MDKSDHDKVEELIRMERDRDYAQAHPDHDLDLSSMTLSIKQTMIIDDLQIQLTKMQIQCLEERRNYIGLVGVNEQLMLENEEFKRKFQAALLLGKVEERGVVHFLQKNPKAPQLTDEIIKVNEDLRKFNSRNTSSTTERPLDNPIVLIKQVNFLSKHLKEVKEQNLVEIFGLKTTLELTLEERILMKEQYEGRIKDVVNKLEECRSLMHSMTEENLKLKKSLILFEQRKNKEISQLQERLTEVENSGCVLDRENEYLNRVGEGGGGGAGRRGNSKTRSAGGKHGHRCVPPVQAHLLEKVTRSEIQMMERDNTIKEYELKFIQMERKLSRAKEEEARTKKTCSDMIRKLQTKNETLEGRFNKLDERRKLDNSGFRSDVQNLRQLLKSIERKLHLFMTRRMLTAAAEQDEREADTEEKQKPDICSPPERLTQGPRDPPRREVHQHILSSKTVKMRGKQVKVGQSLEKGRIEFKDKDQQQQQQQQEIEIEDETGPTELEIEMEAWEKLKGGVGGGEDEGDGEEFDPKDLRRDSKEELERDKLIYELLSRVLETAKGKVHQFERKITKIA